MTRVKTLLTVLVVVAVSLASAHENGGKDSVAASAKLRAPDACFMVPAPERAAGCESVSITLPTEQKPVRSGRKSFFSSVRAEMHSLACTLPDLSMSLFGVSCFFRNPFKYSLSPGSTFAHQIGFSAGPWTLNIDGVRATTLENVNIALQYPVNEKIRLLFRYTDMQYKLDLHAFGKMPWEW